LEFRTLVYLMQHNHRIISKTELTEHIYGQDFDRDSNVINMIYFLCGKLKFDYPLHFT
ncbi:DNA-binding response regulator, partial [Methylococcaceae bacterium HT1]